MADTSWLVPAGVIAGAMITSGYAYDRPRRQRQEILELRQLAESTRDDTDRSALEDLIRDRTRSLAASTPRTRRWLFVSFVLVGVSTGLTVSAVIVGRAQIRDTSHFYSATNNLIQTQDALDRVSQGFTQLELGILPNILDVSATQKASAAAQLKKLEANSTTATAKVNAAVTRSDLARKALTRVTNWSADLNRWAQFGLVLLAVSVGIAGYQFMNESQPKRRSAIREQKKLLRAQQTQMSAQASVLKEQRTVIDENQALLVRMADAEQALSEE